MNKAILLFGFIFAFSLSYYLPMKKKSIDFGDDICHYEDSIHSTQYTYVMGCEKGKYCAYVGSAYDIRKCVPYTPLIRMLGDDCEIDFDCDNGLICTNKKCSLKDNVPYTNADGINFCPSGQIYNETYARDNTENNARKCINKGTDTDKCYIRYEDSSKNVLYRNTYYPDYFKVCGEETYRLDETNHRYIRMSTKMNYIGEVEDGHFVEDERACKSGYALKFYGNGQLIKPFSNDPDLSGGNSLNYQVCVTVKEVEYTSSSTCRIKFTKGDEKEYIYEPSRNNPDVCDEFLMTKLEMFQKYLERMNSIRDQCETQRHYDAPFLCDDNELKKWYYFYDNPDDYLL